MTPSPCKPWLAPCGLLPLSRGWDSVAAQSMAGIPWAPATRADASTGQVARREQRGVPHHRLRPMAVIPIARRIVPVVLF